jgi:hypothetical protein
MDDKVADREFMVFCCAVDIEAESHRLYGTSTPLADLVRLLSDYPKGEK